MSSRGGRHECVPLSFGPCDFEFCLLALPAVTGHKLGRRFDGQVVLHAGVGLEAVPARSGQPAFTDRNIAGFKHKTHLEESTNVCFCVH
jgi:hypothetical protein